jgi:hypothetical protein
MKLQFLLVLCAAAFVSKLHAQVPQPSSAIGIAPASFKSDCLPMLKGQEDILRVAAAFDIQDAGRCMTGGGPPAGNKFSPFVFLARPKSSTGGYDLLFVVHDGLSIAMAVGGFKDEQFAHKFAIAVLPRDIVPTSNPVLYFPQ